MIVSASASMIPQSYGLDSLPRNNSTSVDKSMVESVRSKQRSTQNANKELNAASGAPDTAKAPDAAGKAAPAELTPEQKREVAKLKATDSEVRAHEQAHMAAGGSLIKGAASYSYQTGPDKQRYAVGGEVSIDTSAGRTAQETLYKAQRIQAAALAPAKPSAQDQSVAASARSMEIEAQIEIMIEKREAQRAKSTNGVGSYQAIAENQDSAPAVGNNLTAYA